MQIVRWRLSRIAEIFRELAEAGIKIQLKIKTMSLAHNFDQKKTPEILINTYQHEKDKYKDKIKEIDNDASIYDLEKKKLKHAGWRLLKRYRDEVLQDIDNAKRQAISEKERETFQTNRVGFSDAAKEFFDMEPDQLKDRIKYYSRIGDETKSMAAVFQAQVNNRGDIVKEFINNAGSDTQKAYQEYLNLKAQYNDHQAKLTESMKMSMPPEP